jgi:hypothetical protein
MYRFMYRSQTRYLTSTDAVTVKWRWAGLGVDREMDRYMDRDVDDGLRESVGVGWPVARKGQDRSCSPR